MEELNDINTSPTEKLLKKPTLTEELSEKVRLYEATIVGLSEKVVEKANELEIKISELSHLNQGETGFNPTSDEMAVVFEGIKAEVQALGKEKKKE